MRTICIIPARLGSTRLKEKLLLRYQGRPILRWTYESAMLSRAFDEVIIATDSERICDEARKWAGIVSLTGDCESGTDRVWRVVDNMREKPSIIVNLQGDEPGLEPADIYGFVLAMTDQSADVFTGITAYRPGTVYASTAIGSMMISSFSRRGGQFSHIGIYGYTYDSLKEFCSLPQTAGEKSEKLEQLRGLENGMKYKGVYMRQNYGPIDTDRDYRHFCGQGNRYGN